MSKGIDSYLARYGEPIVDIHDPDRIPLYSAAVVLVAFDEGDDLLDAIRSLTVAAQNRPRALVVVVVNGFDEAPPSAHRRNESSLVALAHVGKIAAVEGVISPRLFCRRLDAADLWVLDYATVGRRIPEREGVGRARKIGCDLVLKLWSHQRIVSPWIRTTDADVTVPLSYFAETWEHESAGCSAWVYPFRHIACGTDEEKQAIAKYDGYLRYYVAGLKWAGSIYDFPTIGSTISVHVESYAAVRGFPRRNAAEDFYILDKLRKVGPVRVVSSPALELSGRPSHRVPFGTGRAVSKISKDLQNAEHYRVENPLAFVALRAMLQTLAAMGAAAGKSSEYADTLWDNALRHHLPDGLDRLRDATSSAVSAVGAKTAAIDAARRVKTPDALRRRLEEWFDAFRTLKFLHLLRDHGVDNVTYETALETCPFRVELPPQGPEV